MQLMMAQMNRLVRLILAVRLAMLKAGSLIEMTAVVMVRMKDCLSGVNSVQKSAHLKVKMKDYLYLAAKMDDLTVTMKELSSDVSSVEKK